jgi:uncharacterized protein (TIGR00251 family)
MTVEDLFTAGGDDAVMLSVHAQPGAGRSQVVGRHGHALKVKVAAPPEQGRANEALVALLSDRFGVPAKSVTLTSGASSRTKQFRIEGVDPAEFADLLERAIDEDAQPGSRRRGKY